MSRHQGRQDGHPPSGAPIRRWPKYDRHGVHVADAISMDRDDWGRIPEAWRPEAWPDRATDRVYFLAEVGWEPVYDAPPANRDHAPPSGWLSPWPPFAAFGILASPGTPGRAGPSA